MYFKYSDMDKLKVKSSRKKIHSMHALACLRKLK